MSGDPRNELRQVAAHLDSYDGDYENAERVGRALREYDRLLAENARLREALAFVMKQYDVPNAALTREQSAALAAPSTETDAKVWGPERMRHDPEPCA